MIFIADTDGLPRNAHKLSHCRAGCQYCFTGKIPSSYLRLQDFPRLRQEESLVEIDGVTVGHAGNEIGDRNLERIARRRMAAVLRQHFPALDKKSIKFCSMREALANSSCTDRTR